MSFQFGAPAAAPAVDDKKDDDNEMVDDPEVAVTDGGAAKFAAVEVKSGEESYEAIACIKSKIFRFDEGENQWKERGQGDAKILRHRTSGKFLFVHRREGTGKLAAQHAIVPEIKLQANPKSDKVVTWTAPMDFSDDPNEGYPETFLVRFATKELSDEFQKAFKVATSA